MGALREKCSERIYSAHCGPSGHQCERNGIFTEDGKPWCKQHAPSEVAKRRAERHAVWEAKSSADASRHRRTHLAARVLGILLKRHGFETPEAAGLNSDADIADVARRLTDGRAA